MGDSAKVIELVKARLSPKERARVEHEEREIAAGKIPLRTRWDAIKWGDAWMERAYRLDGQIRRMSMLLYCAEVNLKASELLLEHANAELERLRKVTQ